MQNYHYTFKYDLRSDCFDLDIVDKRDRFRVQVRVGFGREYVNKEDALENLEKIFAEARGKSL